MVFAASYVLGCIFAVLAVRQSGIFTAVIQPPLILFVAVPTAYFLFHGGQLGGIKDLAINCGYPLIERFPLMFFTSAAVLLIGMGRWYYGMSSRRGAARSTTKDAKEKTSSRVSSVTSKMSSLLTGEPADSAEDADDTKESPRRRHTIERPTRAAKSGSRPQAPPAAPKRPSAPHRRDRGTPGRRRPRSSSRSPSVPVGPGRPGRANSRHPPSRRVAARARRRLANPARPCHRPTGAPPTSGQSGAAATTTISRESPMSATETGRIIRSRGCAIAAAGRTATTALSTGPGRARHVAAGKRTAGSTTFKPARS